MSLHNLMADEKARQYYLAISPDWRDAVSLADTYLEAKLDDNKAACLAIEAHLRQLAQIHFDKPVVLQGLEDMERHKAKRKRGKSAPKALQSIADQIEMLYLEKLFDILPDGRIQFRAFTGGTPGQKAPRPHIKITCKNAPGAVKQVIAKYRQGIPKSRPGKYGSANA